MKQRCVGKHFLASASASLRPLSASLPSKFWTFQVLKILQTQFQDFPGGVGTLKSKARSGCLETVVHTTRGPIRGTCMIYANDSGGTCPLQCARVWWLRCSWHPEFNVTVKATCCQQWQVRVRLQHIHLSTIVIIIIVISNRDKAIYTACYWETTATSQSNHQPVSRRPYADLNRCVLS